MENLMRTAPSCPRCHSSHVVPILYGLPDSRGVDMMQRGEVVLGGCCSSSQSPRWSCRECSADIQADGVHYEWRDKTLRIAEV